MKKTTTAFLLGILSIAGLAGCNSSAAPATYVDLTENSIYGKLSDFSKETVSSGDTLTFKVTPSKYFFIDNITNNGVSCKRVSMNPDGSYIYSTVIQPGENKLKGAYSVDPSVDFVDEFKLNVSDEIFNEVISKHQKEDGEGIFTDLDFRRAGIEQMRAPNEWKNGVKEKTDNFVNYVDGDTTHLETLNLGYTVKIRYLSIDTPESTSEIEKWGLSASYYSKYIYSGEQQYKTPISATTDFAKDEKGKDIAGATSVILVSQAASIHAPEMKKADLMLGSREKGPYAATTDGNQRNLAYVWYSTKENPTKNDFRCLNLEMVYQGFSFGVGSMSDTSEYIYKMFDAANLSAQANGRHLYSEDEDKNYYDWERKGVQELTLERLYETAKKDETIGYYPESPLCDKKTLFAIEGYVSRKVGTSFYMQNKKEYTAEDIANGNVYGIYVFTYSETPIKKGDLVRVVGAVSSYGGTFQMQGISYHTLNPDPVRDTRVISKGHTIVPIKVTGEEFNNNKYPMVLVELDDNIYFYDFQSSGGGDLESLGEGGVEEVNKYNTAYPFYNTSNSPIFYGSFGETDNSEALNESTKTTKNGVRYSNNVIRFTVDQNILVYYGVEISRSFRFFTGGTYLYNPMGAEFANLDDDNPYKDQTITKTYNRKIHRKGDGVTTHGLIVISHGYESTGGNKKMTATICSGAEADITLEEAN